MEQKTIAIQTEDGSTVATVSAAYGPSVITIKRLGWRRLEDAEKAQSKAALQTVRDLGGMAAVRELTAGIQEAGGVEEAKQQAAKDPAAAYDKSTLIVSGVVAFDGAAPTPAAVDELEPETATAVAREVLRLSRPALFETEAERKNA